MTTSQGSEREIGMLDVGTHCSLCEKLDFLPFHCSSCNKDFCSEHRSKQSHYCESLKQQTTTPRSSETVRGNDEQYFKSLLPEKGYIRVNQPHVRNPVSTNEAVLGNGNLREKNTIRSRLNESTLSKLKSFFDKHRSSNNKKTSRSFFSSKKSNNDENEGNILLLKKSAIGDSKIPTSNRIHIWCYYLEGNSEQEGDANSVKTAVFINKIWPLGRTLDYLAQQLQVKNLNSNFKTTKKEKLYLYKEIKAKDNVDFKLLELSDRVANELHDKDVVYLVRGDDVIA
ncbi:Cuz1p NDAI_0F03140 [Naumovozyma dairenensis CBS 421]|uniref:AN1-type domain-containing protein n=1 Tax=Naumovozyma dairenensis (strain ATCC 10597 / BCRC 20456 / CBS 421 / NBRC 0211 / NRRL Y-12639) TaxID=1071378 RepID=G0WCX1_NAUDC|nr:hypothetical protein NDAI_0F03140 [Naumovozyma dairenensis CBS 421]CCD25632.1 hypothetical protein NDAI_0F03140 [Naumovozyma dairenensis CBS 421]